MNENRLLDIRTVNRNIKAGKMTQEEYDTYLESLEDCAEDAEETETQMILHVADDDGESGGDEA